MKKIKNNFYYKSKKQAQVKKNKLTSLEKNEQNAQSAVPVLPISSREIAMSYLLW